MAPEAKFLLKTLLSLLLAGIYMAPLPEVIYLEVYLRGALAGLNLCRLRWFCSLLRVVRPLALNKSAALLRCKVKAIYFILGLSQGGGFGEFLYEIISWFGIFIVYGLIFLLFVFVVRRLVIKKKPEPHKAQKKPGVNKSSISTRKQTVLGYSLAQPMELYGSSFAPGRSDRYEAPQKSGRESSSIYDPGKDPLEK